MPTDRLAAIVESFTQGALTEAEVSSLLLELAGTEGDARALLSRPPRELVTVLGEPPLIVKPPASPNVIVIVESYCGPELPPAEDKKRYLEKQALTFRGAWNL